MQRIYCKAITRGPTPMPCSAHASFLFETKIKNKSKKQENNKIARPFDGGHSANSPPSLDCFGWQQSPQRNTRVKTTKKCCACCIQYNTSSASAYSANGLYGETVLKCDDDIEKICCHVNAIHISPFLLSIESNCVRVG